MNIEYPPSISGNSREMILQIRSYLYRLAEQLNFELTPETLPKTLPIKKMTENTEAIPKGMRLIASAPDGWTLGTYASELPVFNLAGFDDFDIFAVVISGTDDSSDTVTVPCIRCGDTIMGSVTARIYNEDTPVTFLVGISPAETGNMASIRLTQSYYIKHKTDGNDQFNLPGTLSDNYAVRALYAFVI